MVSVIITAKNEAANLRACLESIQKQIYRRIELIVVDNHSSDDTKQIARTFTRHVYDAGPERSAQRNVGARAAAGSYVLFLDADMVLTPTVISSCVMLCEKNGLKGTVIPEKSFGIGFWARCKTIERSCYEHVDWIESARFFRKDAFTDIGGYDEALTGPEDFELPQRVKSRWGNQVIGRIDAYILHDEGRLSLAKLLRKKYYYGKRMPGYKNTRGSGEYFRKQSNIFLRYWLFLKHFDLFFRDPVHYVGMLFMKIFEMSALALGGI